MYHLIDALSRPFLPVLENDEKAGQPADARLVEGKTRRLGLRNHFRAGLARVMAREGDVSKAVEAKTSKADGVDVGKRRDG